MKAFLLATFVFGFASASTCDTVANCNQCASTKGNALGNCRWCALDNQCHTPGSVGFNPCSTSQNIITPDKCPPTPAPSTSFSQSEAVDMTRYSRAAYAETAEIDGCKSITKTFLPSTFSCIKSAVYDINYAKRNFTVLSYYGYDKGTNRIILSFRGSVNQQALWEALITLTEKPIPFPASPSALTNPFFMTGAIGLTNAMGADYAWLKSLMATYPTATVFVTGHSLGGAMASLVGVELAIKGIVTPVVYTFGQPRTGDSTYAALTTKTIKRMFRIVNANDPVPHVPFCTGTCDACSYGNKCDGTYNCCSLSGTNVHHSTEMWFPSGEYQNSVMCGFRECTGAPLGEDASCSNRYTLADLSLSAHSGYWNALNGFCSVAPLGAQPNYEAIQPHSSSTPFFLSLPVVGAAALAFMVLLTGVLVWLRSRARKASAVDEFHLLESYSVPS